MPAKMIRLALLTFTCLALAASSATAATVVNGDFESDTTTGWTTASSDSSIGNWETYAPCVCLPPAFPSPRGAASLLGTQGGESWSNIFQDVALESGMSHVLNLNYWVFANQAFLTPDPPSLKEMVGSVQTGRIDVIKPTADPGTTNPADVLATIYKPAAGSATLIPWSPASADLSAFAGQTVRIRAAFNTLEGPLAIGLDDVSITSKDNAPPVLSGVKTSSSKYEVGAKKPGFKLTFSSGEAGSSVATFTKSSKGRKSGSKCVKQTKKNRKAKACTRWTPVKGTLTLPVVAGVNSLSFKGKLNGKSLKAGTYRITLVVTDAAGNAAAPVVKTFKVLPKKKRK